MDHMFSITIMAVLFVSIMLVVIGASGVIAWFLKR